ncbi:MULTISPECIES: hypothetical protein [unclassified Pseudomonas]|uniref:hypothetical protein n=1 Tax=unclassified Pseudomonas TaxID=196821 RepID=UPI002097165B|nr:MULTISPECIES: hypothetical protein [unclassified Pseudomonas]MCO7518780.1 hypothetical protein [Pseudomonas sp. 1]MCO7540785.1 hypothetical protein [Pseudomonas sp. VA159-2]
MSELSTLTATLTARVREALPALASVDSHDHADTSPALPALRHGILRMTADGAPRDGRSVLLATFEADITPDPTQPEARLQGSELAAQLMDLLRQQLWGLDFVEACRNVQAQYDGPGWKVRWEQPILFGEPRWDWSDQPPGSLMLGLDPDTGPGKQQAYWAPEDLA